MALKTGEKVNVNKEFRALGTANIVGSFFSSLAVSGSFTRSTISQDSGGSSRLTGVIAACVLALVAVSFGPYVKYVPKTALAGIIIFTAFKMIDWSRIRLIGNATRGDAFAMGVTFIATLTVPLDSAIYLGVIASIAGYLHRPATVEVDALTSARGAQIEMIRKAARDCPAINILHIEGDLYFGAADDFADQLAKLANTEQKVLILRLRRTRNFDITALSVLSAFIKDQRAKGKHVLLSGVNKVLYGLLKRTGLVDLLGPENVFQANEDREILISTRDSVLRAVQIVKSSECEGCTRANECSLTHMVE
jgi:SulP family sulfate permease